jgi:hypothetical protein
LKPLKTSYQDLRTLDKDPLLLTPELADRLKRAKYFTEQDLRWGYDNERIKNRDYFETNQVSFEPMVIFFSLCFSPTTSQTRTNEIFQNQKKHQTIDNIDYNSKTKEEATENT